MTEFRSSLGLPAGSATVARVRESEEAALMSRRKAAVLYTHPLFGEGIARLLASEPQLRVVSVDARNGDAHARIAELHPDIVITEGDAAHPELLELFREAPSALIVCVELDDSRLSVYRNWQLSTASLDDLKNVVHGRWRRKHADSPTADVDGQ